MIHYSLLPKKFKLVGLSVIILAYIIPVFMGLLHLFPNLSGWKQDMSKTGLLLGLFVIAITSENIEDEFVRDCRLKSMFVSFLVSIMIYLGTIIVPLLSIKVFSYSGFRVLFFELSIYLISFYLAVRGGLFSNDK
ncbi:MAG: hypothetical protein JST09_02075 [Bacteroidetes bacterium]|nr:hypothetical protein [Bacteroidota bacterium]